MKTAIKNTVLKNLANAPRIAAHYTVKNLSTAADKEEATRLFKALGINLSTAADKEEAKGGDGNA